MQNGNRKLEIFFLVLLMMIVVGLPVGIAYYNHYATQHKFSAQAKHFTLTGHAERGWLIGSVPAVEAISFWQKQGQPVESPVIEVNKADQQRCGPRLQLKRLQCLFNGRYPAGEGHLCVV